jgi:hypothetical protein
MRGNFWRGILVLIFGIAMNIVVLMVLEVPGAVLAALIPGVVTLALKVFSNLMANVLFTPLISIAFTLLYYDSRIRKEAFDLEIMARDLGAPRAPSAAGPAAAGPRMAARAPASPSAPMGTDETLLMRSQAAPPPPASPPPAAPPRRAPRAPTATFKVCPKCNTQVPLIRPTCPNCGTPVPFRPAG